MAVALGSNLESVLVDTRETGIASIQFLKENKFVDRICCFVMSAFSDIRL